MCCRTHQPDFVFAGCRTASPSRAASSLSPAVRVFLQVCVLTLAHLCLSELLQPVRTRLCPAVRVNTLHQGSQGQTFAVEEAAKHLLLFVRF